VTAAPLTIRLCRPDDACAVDRLAALDSRPVPPGRLLLAELDGELIAVVAVRGGDAIADPFRPTADAVALLRARAAQIQPCPPARGLLRRLLPAV
jgi:hypothetical protein